MSRIEFSFVDKGEHATGKQLDLAMGWDRPFQSGWIYLSVLDIDLKLCDSKLQSHARWENADALFAWLLNAVRKCQPELVIALGRAFESPAGVAAKEELEQHIRQGCRCNRPDGDPRCSHCGGINYAITVIEDDGSSLWWREWSEKERV